MPTVYQSPSKHKKHHSSTHPLKGHAATHHSVHPPKHHQTDSFRAHQSKMGPLAFFAPNPVGVRFETQQADETVVLFLRQHFIVNISWILLSILLVLAPSILFPLFLQNVQLPFDIPAQHIIVGTLFWYIATLGFSLASFLRWFFNIYIVTNERVVDIDFHYLLYKHFAEARLEDIQDISYTRGGIVATVFNYGNVMIQTAGESPNFEFMSVPNPDKVVQTISELAEEVKEQL